MAMMVLSSNLSRLSEVWLMFGAMYLITPFHWGSGNAEDHSGGAPWWRGTKELQLPTASW